MRLSCLFLSLVVGSSLVACGGDDDPMVVLDAAPQIDAAPMIDAPPQTVNALGQLCPIAQGGGGTECPAGNACVALDGVGTNTTTGYCTPACMGNNTICMTGYTGPGTPVCALSAPGEQTASGCAIVCQDNSQCPTGLTCTPVPGQQQPISVCVPS